MKIQGLTSLNITKLKLDKGVISKLNIGDKLTVQVLSNNEGEVILKLPNGEIINASMTLPSDINVGDFLELSLTDKTESKIIFQTLKLETATQNIEQTYQRNLDTILLSLKIPADDRNIEIAKELLNQKLPINNDTFFEVINSISKFGVDIPKAVFMVANNLVQIQDSSKILNNILLNTSSLDNLINDLCNHLSAQDTRVLDGIIKEFNLLSVSNKIQDNNQNIYSLINNFNNSIDNIASLAKSIASQIANFTILDSEIKLEFNNISESKFDSIIQRIANSFDVNLNQSIVGKENNTSKKIIDFFNHNTDVKENIINLINDKYTLEKFILEHDNINIINSDSKSENTEIMIRKFLNFPNTNKIEGIEDRINVNKLYNEILTKLDLIEQSSLSYKLSNNENILNIISNIRNTVSVINNINNMFYYFQIPINMNNKNTNLELYIAKNSNNKKNIDPNNTSFFISLNTKRLGLVEAFITMNYRKIDMNFNVQNNQIMEFIKKNQNNLQKLIENKGYTIANIKYSVNQKKTNLLNASIAKKKNNDITSGVDIKI